MALVSAEKINVMKRRILFIWCKRVFIIL